MDYSGLRWITSGLIRLRTELQVDHFDYLNYFDCVDYKWITPDYKWITANDEWITPDSKWIKLITSGIIGFKDELKEDYLDYLD